MSMAPHLLPKSRLGQKMGNWEMQDSMIKDGLWCAFNDYHMGVTAENLADLHSFSKEDQDHFAAKSQNKVEAAQAAGKFDNEICPVSIPQRRGDPIIFDKDEFPRAGVTAEALSKVRAAFKKGGSVSAANASGLNDGAAAVMVTSEEYALANGLRPLARIVAYASAGVDPSIMGCGPIPATKLCLDKAGWTVRDLDLIEANEAFAVQSLTVMRGLGLDQEKVRFFVLCLYVFYV
jgi:acetyl-CoA C-acetyltransferase